MDVLGEILTWSEDRPEWQRDALRRLVLKGELDDADIEALTEICKSAYGLACEQDPVPIGREHLPVDGANSGRVNVDSISHRHGVNALAENQSLKFGPGLTVVYGDNAAGKSGYIRIFKSACRARGAEDILGNVLSGTATPTPEFSIPYTVGGGPTQEWSGQDDDEAIARVSVFDRHSEAVYTTQKTDVAFRPFGLDLFDRLSKACATVRSRLEHEQRSLKASKIQMPDLPRDTVAAKFVARLSSLTSPDEVKAHGTLSEDDSKRLKLIEKQLLDAQVSNPTRIAQELTLRGRRLRNLSKHIKKLDNSLSGRAIKSVFEVQSELQRKRERARKLREDAFQAHLLPGTGSNNWSEMWEAGRRFSEESAYPTQPFPFTDDGARCILCQQRLEPDATTQLRLFEEFVTSAAERDVRAAGDTFERLRKDLESISVSDSGTEDSLRELSIEDEALAKSVASTLSLAAQRQTTILEALANGKRPGKLAELPSNTKDVEMLADQLAVRAEGLREGTSGNQKDALMAELKELKARQTLGTHEEAMLSEIERMKKIAAYAHCLNDTDTRSITTKSTAVTKEVVTQQLKTAFKEELNGLRFRHVEVELKEAGGQTGNFYHKLILTRAPDEVLPNVVSEGEARCLAIAAFFAELSTADDTSAILLDDPVSSFDYKWRDSVAQRLVAEAKKRQVIVFTHDIVFLHLLREYAKQDGVESLDQHVRQEQIGAGVCDAELPWVATKVSKRIGHLNKLWQEAEKLFRQGNREEYEIKAGHIYGRLREAWERGVEEILLGGVVERFRESIQTQRIGNLAGITPDDCNKVEVAMTKSSKWLTGHDQAPAARQDIPEPDELRQDIAALKSWVSNIRKRQS
ncbi:MAG: AAA family ATPase [Caldilineaceae bacterium]|nr:AAA family ATPase [Caldilineaceae bacterium]